jgi:hypothetical protein
MDKEVFAQAPSGFDAIFAAASHSQLAGVLAAVVFTVIILLLSDRTSPPPIPWSRQNALIVMVPTFVGLLVVSFCFAVTMGETECKACSGCNDRDRRSVRRPGRRRNVRALLAV